MNILIENVSIFKRPCILSKKHPVHRRRWARRRRRVATATGPPATRRRRRRRSHGLAGVVVIDLLVNGPGCRPEPHGLASPVGLLAPSPVSPAPPAVPLVPAVLSAAPAEDRDDGAAAPAEDWQLEQRRRWYQANELV